MNVIYMAPVDPDEMKERARNVVKELIMFAVLKASDPEKQKLLDRLSELRFEIQDVMDVLAPGWEDFEGQAQKTFGDAVKTLSTPKVELDVGFTDDGSSFWRFLFRRKPLVSVFENGIVLVDRSAKLSKTRRNYCLELAKVEDEGTS